MAFTFTDRGSIKLTLLIQSRSQYLGMQSNTVWSNSLVVKQNIQMILQTFCSNTRTQKLEGLLGFPDLHSAHFQRMSYIVSAGTIPVAERVQTFCHQSNCICIAVPEMYNNLLIFSYSYVKQQPALKQFSATVIIFVMRHHSVQ